MLISIVTITYNDLENLKITQNSIKTQKCQNIEWIVIDGNSEDGTKEFIYNSSFQPEIFISEADSGLYDAMNKGIKLVTGDYIVFLNAGDIFPIKETLSNIESKIKVNQYPDFIYGDVIEITMNSNKYLRKSRSIECINIGMFTCHQSMYYKNQIIQKNNFSYNLDYKIFADYNFTCKFLNVSQNSLYINEPLSIFELGGLSTNRWYEGLLENNNTRKTILKMPYIKRKGIHYAQVFWHLIKFKAPFIHRLIRYKKHKS